MLMSRAIVGLFLCTAILVGCHKREETKTDGTAGGSVTPPTPESPAIAAPSLSVTPPGDHPTSLPSLPPDSVPVTTATPTTGDDNAEARKLLTAVSVDAADQKWDAAEAALQKLDALKEKLDPPTQEAVAKAHEQFTAAKAASTAAPVGLPAPTTTPEANK